MKQIGKLANSISKYIKKHQNMNVDSFLHVKWHWWKPTPGAGDIQHHMMLLWQRGSWNIFRGNILD